MALSHNFDAGWSGPLAFLATCLLLIGVLTGCQKHDAHSAHGGFENAGDEHHYTFRARMSGYYGVGGAIDGVKNPRIRVKPGDRVSFTIINDEMMAHDIALERHRLKSEIIVQKGEQTTFRFVARYSDTYYCSIPGHRQSGMVGQLEVVGDGPMVSEQEQHAPQASPPAREHGELAHHHHP
jgi:nitrite reductase (NO-forming)